MAPREWRTMSSEWVPPAMDVAGYERLGTIELGFPDYLRRQVVSWIAACARTYSGYFIEEVSEKLSLRLKTPLPDDAFGFQEYLNAADHGFVANVIDAMLYFNLGSAVENADDLKEVLEEGKSEWALESVAGRPRLVERIPTGVQLAYEDIVNKTALAGQLLAEAFDSVYGVTPNPNHSYDLCVKAVETVACRAFIPNNVTRGTLGAVISHLEQKSVSLPLIQKNAGHGETLTKMMRLLWEGGQRHGSGHYEHVSLEGAKTAQALAFSLVAMIHEGLITTA